MIDSNKMRSLCYDTVKVLTVLLVVLAHVLRMYCGDGAFDPLVGSRPLRWLALFIYNFHMPLFVLISGCVYGRCIAEGKYARFLPFAANKAKRLLIPYFAFGFLWVAPAMVLMGLTEQGYFEYCLDGIILAYNSRHLWYLLTLFWVFMIAAAMKPLLLKDKPWYLLVCAVLFFVYLKLATGGLLQLASALRYQLFFCCGVALDRHFETLTSLAHRLRAVIFTLFPAALILGIIYNPNWASQLGWNLLGIIWFVTVAYEFTTHCGDRFSRLRAFEILRRDGFGVYLFHPMIIYVIFYFLGGTMINAYLLSAIAFAVSTAVSLALTQLVRKARLGILIGENPPARK